MYRITIKMMGQRYAKQKLRKTEYSATLFHSPFAQVKAKINSLPTIL